ncbi:MAG: hypothetical protein IIZ93_16090 [Acidaminococcaceae bacterium]|nr:hypothetical protein [Acidaminococcaceae bacterium]
MENTYNYLEAVKADVIEAIKYDYTADEIKAGFEDRDAFRDRLYDDLWTSDSVTGNGSGSYTFDRLAARDYVLGDMDTVAEALREFCVEASTIGEKFLAEDWEYFDVTARCYVLGQAIDEALDALEDAEGEENKK